MAGCRAAISSVAISAVLLTAACGGDNTRATSIVASDLTTTTAPPLTEAEWLAAAAAICAQYEPQMAAAEANAGEPTTLAELDAFFEVFVPIVNEYFNAVLRLPLPAGAPPEAGRTYDVLREGLAVMDELAAAVNRGDVNGALYWLDQFDVIGQELDALAGAEPDGQPTCVT